MVALLDRGQTGDFEKCCHAGGALLLFALGWLRRRKPPSAPGSFTAHPVPLSGSTSPNSRPMPPRHGRGATEPPRPKSKLPSAASGTGRPAPRGPDSGRCSNAPHLSSSKMRNACPGCCAAPSARLRASSTRYGGALLIRGPLCTRIAGRTMLRIAGRTMLHIAGRTLHRVRDTRRIASRRCPSPLLVRMHPQIRRDLARLGQLDHVHRRRIAALAA
jgi:hypothetical protein